MFGVKKDLHTGIGDQGITLWKEGGRKRKTRCRQLSHFQSSGKRKKKKGKNSVQHKKRKFSLGPLVGKVSNKAMPKGGLDA